ncbi:MAG: hypothetical protein SGJ19_05155 [Planctomycetia bacterium]|nr:hypothetical protein [Planctomycetia bacterium]
MNVMRSQQLGASQKLYLLALWMKAGCAPGLPPPITWDELARFVGNKDPTSAKSAVFGLRDKGWLRVRSYDAAGLDVEVVDPNEWRSIGDRDEQGELFEPETGEAALTKRDADRDNEADADKPEKTHGDFLDDDAQQAQTKLFHAKLPPTQQSQQTPNELGERSDDNVGLIRRGDQVIALTSKVLKVLGDCNAQRWHAPAFALTVDEGLISEAEFHVCLGAGPAALADEKLRVNIFACSKGAFVNVLRTRSKKCVAKGMGLYADGSPKFWTCTEIRNKLEALGIDVARFPNWGILAKNRHR